MRRPALYSSSRSQRPAGGPPPAAEVEVAQEPAAVAIARPSRFNLSSPRLLWAAILLLATLLTLSLTLALRPGPRRITQEDIDKAVVKTMETQVLPSEYAKAY